MVSALQYSTRERLAKKEFQYNVLCIMIKQCARCPENQRTDTQRVLGESGKRLRTALNVSFDSPLSSDKVWGNLSFPNYVIIRA